MWSASDHGPGARAPQGVAARAWRIHGTKEHAAGCPWTGCRDAGRAGTPIPDSDKQTCEAVRSAPALPENGSEVRRANVILEFVTSRVQRYKQDPRRRSSERDTDA